jgi:hypothetical protein
MKLKVNHLVEPVTVQTTRLCTHQDPKGKKREANIANQYGLTLVSDYLILKNIVALVDIYQSELLFILLCISLL